MDYERRCAELAEQQRLGKKKKKKDKKDSEFCNINTLYSLFLLDNIIIIQDNNIELSLKLFHDVSINIIL